MNSSDWNLINMTPASHRGISGRLRVEIEPNFRGETTIEDEESYHEVEQRRPHSFKGLRRKQETTATNTNSDGVVRKGSSHSKSSRRRSLPGGGTTTVFQSPLRSGSKANLATSPNDKNNNPTTGFQSPSGVCEGAAVMMTGATTTTSESQQTSSKNAGKKARNKSKRKSPPELSTLSPPLATASGTLSNKPGPGRNLPKLGSTRSLFSAGASTPKDNAKRQTEKTKKAKSRGRNKESHSKHSGKEEVGDPSDAKASKSERRSQSPVARMLAYKNKIMKAAKTKREGKKNHPKGEQKQADVGEEGKEHQQQQEDEQDTMEQGIENLKSHNTKLRKENKKLRKRLAEQSLDETTTQHFAAAEHPSAHHQLPMSASSHNNRRALLQRSNSYLSRSSLHLECYEKVNEGKDKRIAAMKKRITYLEVLCLENGIDIKEGGVDDTSYHYHRDLQQEQRLSEKEEDRSVAYLVHKYGRLVDDIMMKRTTMRTATTTPQEKSSSTHGSFFGDSVHQSLHPQHHPELSNKANVCDDEEEEGKGNAKNEISEDDVTTRFKNTIGCKASNDLESSLGKLPGRQRKKASHTFDGNQSGVISEAAISLDLADVMTSPPRAVKHNDDDYEGKKDSWLSLSADLAFKSTSREEKFNYRSGSENTSDEVDDDDDDDDIWEESLNDGDVSNTSEDIKEEDDCIGDTEVENDLKCTPSQLPSNKDVQTKDQTPPPVLPARKIKMTDSWSNLSFNLTSWDDSCNVRPPNHPPKRETARDSKPPRKRQGRSKLATQSVGQGLQDYKTVSKRVDATGMISQLPLSRHTPPRNPNLRKRASTGAPRRSGSKRDLMSESPGDGKVSLPVAITKTSNTGKPDLRRSVSSGDKTGNGRRVFGGKSTPASAGNFQGNKKVTTVLNSLESALGDRMDVNAADMPLPSSPKLPAPLSKQVSM